MILQKNRQVRKSCSKHLGLGAPTMHAKNAYRLAKQTQTSVPEARKVPYEHVLCTCNGNLGKTNGGSNGNRQYGYLQILSNSGVHDVHTQDSNRKPWTLNPRKIPLAKTSWGSHSLS